MRNKYCIPIRRTRLSEPFRRMPVWAEITVVNENADSSVEYASFEWIQKHFGISRTRQYALAGAGRIRVVRMGGRSRVDVASVRRYMASLPPAPIRVQAA